MKGGDSMTIKEQAPPKVKREHFEFYVTPTFAPVMAEVRAMAAAEDVTVGHFVRRAITAYVRDGKGKR